MRLTGPAWHGVAAVNLQSADLSTQGPKKFDLRAAERQVRAFSCPIILRCIKICSANFVLDHRSSRSPSLIVSVCGPPWPRGTNRTVGTKTHIVQQPERIPLAG